MRKKRRSKFRDRVAADAQRQRNQRSQYGHLQLPKGIRMFREEPNTRVRLDFLPYRVTDPHHPDRDEELGIAVEGELWYKRPYKLHRNIGINNETIVCPTSVGKPCPICEYRARLLKEGGKWDDDAVRALRPSDRNLYVVIPLGHKEYEEKPHVWDISQACFQKALNEELEEDEDRAVFPDLEEGYTLRIRFSEEKFGKNTFADTSRIDFIERDSVYSEDILEQVPNLDEVLTILPYKEIEAKLFDMDSEPAEEEEIEQEKGGKKEEEEDVPLQPSRYRRPKEKEGIEREEATISKPKSKKCPYGHVFGQDCEEFDDCDVCEVFDDCFEQKEKEERR